MPASAEYSLSLVSDLFWHQVLGPKSIACFSTVLYTLYLSHFSKTKHFFLGCNIRHKRRVLSFFSLTRDMWLFTCYEKCREYLRHRSSSYFSFIFLSSYYFVCVVFYAHVPIYVTADLRAVYLWKVGYVYHFSNHSCVPEGKDWRFTLSCPDRNEYRK